MQGQKSKANSVVWGDWDTETVRLDFDETPLDEVKYWAYRATFFFKLEGFIVLESSRKDHVIKEKRKVLCRFRKASYLVIFDRPVSWSLNVHIMSWVGLESRNENLRRYVRMQCIKETSTVRISGKDEKPIPQVVFRFGRDDRMVDKFLVTRAFLLDCLKQIARAEVT